MQENIKETLSSLKSGSSIAVIGLSPNEDKPSNFVSKYLQERGFKILPVYPKEEQILGQKVYRNLSEITEKIDLVLMFRKGEFADDLIQEINKKGIKNFWLQLGIKNDQVKEKSQILGINFVQDACIMIEDRKNNDRA